MPRKENTIEAISAPMTITVMVRPIRLACVISTPTSSFETAEFFCADSTTASIRSAASIATPDVRLTTMSVFNCSLLTTSSLAARNRLTTEDNELMTSSSARSSASPRSLLKTSFNDLVVLAIAGMMAASPVAPSRQTAARNEFTLASA